MFLYTPGPGSSMEPDEKTEEQHKKTLFQKIADVIFGEVDEIPDDIEILRVMVDGVDKWDELKDREDCEDVWRDAITEVPADRWEVDAWYDPNPDAPGKMATRWGGFVDGLTDTRLFGQRAVEPGDVSKGRVGRELKHSGGFTVGRVVPRLSASRQHAEVLPSFD